MRRQDVFYVLNLKKMKQDGENANSVVYKNFNQYALMSEDLVKKHNINPKYLIKKRFLGGWLFLGFEGIIESKDLIRVSNDAFDYWTADIIVMNPNFCEKKAVMRINAIAGSRRKVKKLIIIDPKTWEVSCDS